MWQPFDAAFVTGAFEDVHWNNIVFLVLISIALYAIWTVICITLSLPWLDKRDIVAVAYTVVSGEIFRASAPVSLGSLTKG